MSKNNSDTPKVSVIIPVYNSARYFEKCLRSLFEQTLDSIEYIFINDETSDNSMDLLQKVLIEYPKRQGQIRIINHIQNMGTGQSRKDGMKSATGLYVIHCDSDDWIDTDMYERMYQKALEEDADIVMCHHVLEYKHKQIRVEVKLINVYGKVAIIKDPPLFFSLSTRLVKRNLYVDNNVYPFNDVRDMGEDAGIVIRLSYLSKKEITLPQAFYHYNRLNTFSLVSTVKKSHVIDLINCARHIENFFITQNAHDSCFFFIQDFKFRAKSDSLFKKEIRDIDLWRNTFPETHKYIWYYRRWSLLMRFIFWMAAKGMCGFACTLLDIKSKIRYLIDS
jgi:glycosyltransferase involved in cell wall biosynthesis